MKKYIIVTIIALLTLTFISCQDESEKIVQDTSQNFLKNSPVANLILRTTQYPTSNDNILDGTSCFGVQLPVTVTVNGQQIVVANQSGYQTVKNVIDQYLNDDDIVNFNFPITIVFPNFTTQTIQNSNNFQVVLNACEQDNGINEIDCINIVYPLTMNVYNSNNQIANTVTVTNNNLYNFISNISPTTILSIIYPISVINSSGQAVTVNSNSELVLLIEDSIDDCDDNSNGGTTPVFIDVLTSGTWYVSYFYDHEDDTYEFVGYNFTFNSDGTSIAIKNATSTYGTWNTYASSGYNKLDINFNGNSLDEMEDDWQIIEFTSTVINLKHVSGGSGEIHYLTFTKN